MDGGAGIEELYKNYGILADAKENAGLVSGLLAYDLLTLVVRRLINAHHIASFIPSTKTPMRAFLPHPRAPAGRRGLLLGSSPSSCLSFQT